MRNVGDEKIFINGKLNKKFMDVLKKNKCFSYIIDEKYGVYNLMLKVNHKEVKLASVNPSVGSYRNGSKLVGSR